MTVIYYRLISITYGIKSVVVILFKNNLFLFFNNMFLLYTCYQSLLIRSNIPRLWFLCFFFRAFSVLVILCTRCVLSCSTIDCYSNVDMALTMLVINCTNVLWWILDSLWMKDFEKRCLMVFLCLYKKVLV